MSRRSLVVRVLPDVAAIDKTFDYLVPDDARDQVRVGDVVRMDLHGRRVGGWVVAVGVQPPAGVELRPLAKRSGVGPSEDLIELAAWGAWRWAGRPAQLLSTASPSRVVAALPPAPSRAALAPPVGPVLRAALATGRSVVRLPPSANLVAVAAVVADRGNALILCPNQSLAAEIGARLRRDGFPVARHPADWALGRAGATVVGTRAAAWAPVRDLAAVLVLDEHDEAHQQEQAPTWHARDVGIERARRAGVPCLLTSPCPSQEALAWGALHVPAGTRERAGWPVVEVVDRRGEDPRVGGLLSPDLTRHLRSAARVLCILNRKGRAKLLACAACGDLARCERCQAAVTQPGDELECARCGATRPVVCPSCGGTRHKTVRAGVSRVREELEALVGEPVMEVTATTDLGPRRSRVLIGTEALLQRVDQAEVVVFLDLDQELLAPRFRAAEQALVLVARAARIVARSGASRGPRAGGTVVLQTRLPDHEVVQAAVQADPALVAEAEADRRSALALPPVTALAEVSGVAAGPFVAALAERPEVTVVEVSEGRWLVRAGEHRALCDALAATPRPPGRLRVEVDPLRV